MALTDIQARSAKPKEKAFKLTDERGLYLHVMPSGSKYWRFKYRFDGKEKLLAIGVYPEVSLAMARKKRDEARLQLFDNIDPSAHKKIAKTTQSLEDRSLFKTVAFEWFQQYQTTWSKTHGEKILRRLERDVLPWLGSVSIAEITPPNLLDVVRRIESRGAIETAHRTLSNCGQIFRFAVATGRADRDITQDLKGALTPVKAKHFPAITDPKKLGKILQAFDDYEGTLTVKCALKIMPLIFVRPGELRHAKWEDIDFDKSQWAFTASKTQTKHIVPLARQSLQILSELKPLTGNGIYVFPSARGPKRPMSDNAILAAFRRMGIDKHVLTGHGFRATARTLLDEVLGVRPDYIEHQLAHAVRDPNGRAYNRTAFLSERKQMMQDWADYLEQLKKGK